MGFYSWLNSKSRHPAKRNHPRGGALQTPLNKGSLDRPPVALVLLLSAPRSLDASTLAQTVGQTFGVEVASGEVGGPAFVAGASPYFLLAFEGASSPCTMWPVPISITRPRSPRRWRRWSCARPSPSIVPGFPWNCCTPTPALSRTPTG